MGLRRSILAVLLCTGCAEDKEYEPGADASIDTAYSRDPTDTALQQPWDDPDWWMLANGNDADAILGKDPTPGVGWQVLFYRSQDGVNWEEGVPSPLAWEYSTLGLYTTDEVLAVTGFISETNLSGALSVNALYAITTTDTENWSVRAWFVDALEDPLTDQPHEMLVDPQFELGDEATFRLWAFPCEQGGDPAQIKGPHDICTLEFTDTYTIRETECPLSEEGVADPSALMHGGQQLLAATRAGGVEAQREVVIWNLDHAGSIKQLTSWPGSVPYLTHWPDGSIRLWYQYGTDGPQEVFMRQSDDGGLTWSDPTEPLGEDFACTSPVATWFQDQYLFFCAQMLK